MVSNAPRLKNHADRVDTITPDPAWRSSRSLGWTNWLPPRFP